MMKEVLLYPFDSMSEIILKHEKCLDNMRIRKVVSPQGWGYRQDYQPYEITYDFKSALKECDVVWIVNSKNKLSIEILKEKINDAISENKEIIITRELSEKESLELQTIVTYQKCKRIEKGIEARKHLERETLYSIECPIVYIVGATEYTNRFEMLLSLEEAFQKKGYKVVSFSNRKEGVLMGINYLPDIYTDRNVTEVEKIKVVNSLVKSKEINTKPDIIFIQVPGRILGANKFYVEDCAIGMYELSYAIPPDCILLSMMYTENYNEIVHYVQKQCGRLFGISADYINIVDKLLDEPDDENEINYLVLNKEFVQNKMLDFFEEREKLICLQDETSYEKLASKLIELLAGYGNVETM